MEQRQSKPTDGERGRDPFDDPLRDPYGDPPPPPPRGASGIDPATALFVLIDGLRRVVPRELEGQLTNLIREMDAPGGAWVLGLCALHAGPLRECVGMSAAFLVRE